MRPCVLSLAACAACAAALSACGGAAGAGSGRGEAGRAAAPDALRACLAAPPKHLLLAFDAVADAAEADGGEAFAVALDGVGVELVVFKTASEAAARLTSARDAAGDSALFQDADVRAERNVVVIAPRGRLAPAPAARVSECIRRVAR